jgi:hypothetical protein
MSVNAVVRSKSEDAPDDSDCSGGLIIDTSNSVTHRISFEQAAVMAIGTRCGNPE